VIPRSFVVPAEFSGERLDRALVALSSGALSRTRICELIRDGGVHVDGQPADRAARLVVPGERIELLEVKRSRERAGGPAGATLVVLHEDEHLAVIDKPAGQLTHPTTVVRGGTVSELAVERWGELPAPQGDDRPGIVHRLDSDTSGLVVIARSAPAAERLVELFRERAVEKRYLALVHGAPRFDSDWIESPIGRSPRADRMCVMPAGEGKPAATFYQVRERFTDFAFLECRPRTGRTHQIRVHLASIELPLLGDRVYPGRVRRPIPRGSPPLERHLLHAAGLRFAHPITGDALELESPLPADFEAWLEWLRKRPRVPG